MINKQDNLYQGRDMEINQNAPLSNMRRFENDVNPLENFEYAYDQQKNIGKSPVQGFDHLRMQMNNNELGQGMLPSF